MPNTPAQFPNFDLPGAEWFSLAPNAQIAIQGRRAFSYLAPPQTVPTGQGYVLGSAPFETGFIPGSAIYLHRGWLMLQPQDYSETIIESAILSLTVLNLANFPTDGSWGYPLGASSATLTTPAGPFLIIDTRDHLITQRDLAMFNQPGLGSGPPYNQLGVTSTLTVSLLLNTANPGPPQAGVTASVGLIYTRLDGLTQ